MAEPTVRLFVVGFPRSGTTLLQEMLNAHPLVAIAPETHFVRRFWMRRKAFGDIRGDAGWSRLVDAVVDSPGLGDAADRVALAEEARRLPRAWPSLLGLLMDWFARGREARVVGEKTPSHQVHMALLQEWFPDARFLQIVRDPRAAVNSWRGVPWSTGSVLADAAEWRVRHALARRRPPAPGHLLEIRYEDLVAAPEPVLRRVCEFLDIPFSERMLRHDRIGLAATDPEREPWKGRVAERVTASRVDTWKAELQPRQVLGIEAVVGGIMRRHGYAPTAPLPLRLLLTPPARGLATLLQLRHRWRAPPPEEAEAGSGRRDRTVVSDALTAPRNPYGRLLAAGIEAADPRLRVEPYRPRALLRRRAPALWHLHWPESVATAPNPLRRLLDVAGFATAMLAADARGVRRVWTVHNLAPHEGQGSLLPGMVMRGVVARLDGWISLSRAGARLALARYPALERVPRLVTTHGHYGEAYGAPWTRADARRALALDADATVLLFFGMIRPYKNVPRLIAAFRSAGAPDRRLVIAGRPRTRRIAREVARAAEGDARVVLRLGDAPDDHVPVLLGAADGLVLSAEQPLNSGSVLLGLSFGVPVLAPRTPVMEELRDAHAPGALHLFDGGITAEHLDRFVAALPADATAIRDRARALHDPATIGADTAAFLRDIMTGSRGPARGEGVA